MRLFPSYTIEAKAKLPLLGVGYTYGKDSEDADSMKDYIEEIMQPFNKTFNDVNFLVGTDLPANKGLADLVCQPFIGCSSHRFNLACQKYLEPQQTLLKKVNNLMITLNWKWNARKLSEVTDQEPVVCHTSHWSSKFEMLTALMELMPHIDIAFYRPMKSHFNYLSFGKH
jgi:hypothetical protein